MSKRIGLLSASVLLVASQLTHAENIRWNGYVNIVAGGLEYDPRNDDTNKKQRPGYLSYEQKPIYDTQSSAALQASKDLDAKSSITTQVFAAGEGGDYVAKMKWLYLTYNFNDNSTARVGRLGNPAYYFSDFFNVGFAYQWISPPNEIYAFDTTFTGLDYIYRGSIGKSDWTGELFTGSSDVLIQSGSTTALTKSRNLFGGSLGLSTGGWLNLRAMIERSTVTLDIAALTPDNILSQVPSSLVTPELEALVDEKLDAKEANATYAELAARAEFEHLLLMAEGTFARTDRYLLADTDSWFVIGGWKFKRRFMVHLTYSESKTKMKDKTYADIDYVNTHPQSASPDYIAAALGSTIEERVANNRNSWTLGTRYDLTGNIAVKFDVMKFEEKASYMTETAGIGNNVLVRAAVNAVY